MNLPRLRKVGEQVAVAVNRLQSARAALEGVTGYTPGTGRLVVMKDEALVQITPLVESMSLANRALAAQPPAALGEGSTKRYLVPLFNQAELYPGGGAALSVAVAQFTNGAMTIPQKGGTNDLVPAAQIRWQHLVGSPWFDWPNGFGRVVWAHVHPDFRIGGAELARAWTAGGGGRRWGHRHRHVHRRRDYDGDRTHRHRSPPVRLIRGQRRAEGARRCVCHPG